MADIVIGGDVLAQMTGGAFGIESTYTPNYDVLYDSPASILATYIVQQLIMTVPSEGDTWPLYIASMPSGENVENNAGAIYNTTSLKDGRQMSDGFVMRHYGVQIKIRSLDDETGWNKCSVIQALLDEIQNVNVAKDDTTYRIQNVSQTSGIVSLGNEPGTIRRVLFTMNFLVTLEEI